MSKDAAAWTVAIVGVVAEVFLATLDFWFDMPHWDFHFNRTK